MGPSKGSRRRRSRFGRPPPARPQRVQAPTAGGNRWTIEPSQAYIPKLMRRHREKRWTARRPAGAPSEMDRPDSRPEPPLPPHTATPRGRAAASPPADPGSVILPPRASTPPCFLSEPRTPGRKRPASYLSEPRTACGNTPPPYLSKTRTPGRIRSPPRLSEARTPRGIGIAPAAAHRAAPHERRRCRFVRRTRPRGRPARPPPVSQANRSAVLQLAVASPGCHCYAFAHAA